MSIFRNRTPQPPFRPYNEDNTSEPRLFTGKEPEAPEWEEEDYENVHRHPRWSERESKIDQSYSKKAPQDLHPRELSFWNEERFYQDSPAPSVAPLRFVLLIASLIIIATFGWLAVRWLTSPQVTNPPFIYAEPGPYKIPSDSPGGMQTPYQDKDVYNRFHHNPGGGQPVENLLPPPETPMMPSPAPQYPPEASMIQAAPPYPPAPNQGYEAHYGATPQNYAPAAAPVPIQQYSAPEAPRAQPYPQTPPPAYATPGQQPLGQYGPLPASAAPQPAVGYEAPPPAASQPLHAPSPTHSQAPPPPLPAPPLQAPAFAPASPQVPAAADLQIPAPEEGKARASYLAKPSPKPLSKAYRIQVATLVGKAFATKEAARIRDYTALVGSATISVEKVKGTTGVYRVVLGSFKSRDKAIKSCNKFWAHGFSCIVLNPEKVG